MAMSAHETSTQEKSTHGIWLAGMDGCPAGWIVAFARADLSEVRVRLVARFIDVPAAPEAPAVIAIDIPIGLPVRAGYGGRAAENAVRPLLGARQSSVFSVPSRAAIAAQDYREACRIALATSEPPRKVSKQLFMLAPKIREVDAVLRADTTLSQRVFEVHPEVAFWRLNGEQALSEPKKVKSRPYEPGLALRRQLLIEAACRPRSSKLRRPRAPVSMTSSTRSLAPRSRAASSTASRNHSPIRRSGMHSIYNGYLGLSCNGDRAASSWPGSSRPSTSYLR
jgi:predicted RNase H-like nuclease